MSKHIQIESNMSITGSNADLRIPLSVSDQKLFLAHLYKKISGDSSSIQSISDEFVKKVDYTLNICFLILHSLLLFVD